MIYLTNPTYKQNRIFSRFTFKVEVSLLTSMNSYQTHLKNRPLSNNSSRTLTTHTTYALMSKYWLIAFQKTFNILTNTDEYIFWAWQDVLNDSRNLTVSNIKWPTNDPVESLVNQVDIDVKIGEYTCPNAFESIEHCVGFSSRTLQWSHFLHNHDNDFSPEKVRYFTRRH